MDYATPGVPFHGEFSSADASALTEANSRFTLYQGGGKSPPAALTLNSKDIVWVADIQVTSAAAVLVQIYDGADNVVDAGESIFTGQMAVNNTVYPNCTVGKACQIGTYPKVKAGAGQIYCQIHGTIQNLG